MTSRIQFELNGIEFNKAIAKIRYTKAERLLLAPRKGKLYAGFQEAQAIAWFRIEDAQPSKFKPISLDCSEFLNLCKNQNQMLFKGDSKLDAETVGSSFKAKNIPIENWQPSIEHLKFKAKTVTEQYLKFLKHMRNCFRMAIEIDSSLKMIQLMLHKDLLYVTAMHDSSSMAFIATMRLNSGWLQYLKSIEFSTWCIPIDAVRAFLSDDDTIIERRNTRFIVYGAAYHIIFSQFGEAKPIAVYDRLVNTEQDTLINIDYTELNTTLAKLPTGKTVDLAMPSDKKLSLEINGYGRLSLDVAAKKIQGKGEAISLNHRQFKAIINMAHQFKGVLEWGQFCRIKCATERFNFYWLLGKAYNQTKDD